MKRSRSRGMKALSASLALLALGLPKSAHAGTVALTFDDLPGLTILNDQAYVDYLTLLRQKSAARPRLRGRGP